MQPTKVPEKPDSVEKMLDCNVRQKEFYESRFDATSRSPWASERAANLATNTWTKLRRKIQDLRKALGVEEHNIALHREWLGDLKEARILDLGCFSGNELSLYMAENAAEYVGIDLSQKAIDELNEKLRERGLKNARAIAQDFLTNDFPDGCFTVVYAYSVLHHFRDIEVLLKELHRILAPGGIVISTDPMQTEPFNRVARTLYRPLQTDRDWEWPFKFSTFRTIQKYFEISKVQGLQGIAKWGYPLQVVPGLGGLGRAISRKGLDFDNRHATRLGIPFYLCWHVSMRLQKPK
ncbi:MAG TPA: class I SAM-dependent methyltransferase [Fimbriimonas sp.]